MRAIIVVLLSFATMAAAWGAPALNYRFLAGERWVRDAPPDGVVDVNHNFSFVSTAEIIFGRWRAGYSFLNCPGFGYPRHPAGIQEHEFFGGFSALEKGRLSCPLRAGIIVARANFNEQGVEPIITYGESSYFFRPSVSGEVVWRASRRVTCGGRLRYRRRIKAANWSYAPSSFGLNCHSWESTASVRYSPWRIFSVDAAAAFVYDGRAEGFGAGYVGETYPPASEFHVYLGCTLTPAGRADRR